MPYLMCKAVSITLIQKQIVVAILYVKKLMNIHQTTVGNLEEIIHFTITETISNSNICMSDAIKRLLMIIKKHMLGHLILLVGANTDQCHLREHLIQYQKPLMIFSNCYTPSFQHYGEG